MCSQSVKWLTAGLCCPPADGKFSSAFAVRQRTANFLVSLPSATVGKLTKWVSSQEAQLAAMWLLCRLRLMAKSPLPSVADGKEPAYWLFFCFLLNPTIFTANIYDIYRYISQGYLTTNISHIQHISFIVHTYIVPSIHT